MKTINDEIFYSIALQNMKGVGPIMARQLIEHFGSAVNIFRENSESLAAIPRVGARLASEVSNSSTLKVAEKEARFIEANDIDVFVYSDLENKYPSLLRECIDSPILLYYKGASEINGCRMVSIVGTRNSSAYGADMIDMFVGELSERIPGLIIVSGLAYGVDVQAHQKALSCGVPTIGVMAHGLDRVYPYAHRQIARRMIDNGGLITEYISDTVPERGNFIARNRIVAGMSEATVVIETPDKGGSLITASIANSYCRDVFAFPGRANDQRSMGCNRLIRENKASLITSADDFIRLMGWQSHAVEPRQLPIIFDLSPEEQIVVDHLRSAGECQITSLAVSTNIPVGQLSSTLLDLEFRSIVRSRPGGVYTVIQ